MEGGSMTEVAGMEVEAMASAKGGEGRLKVTVMAMAEGRAREREKARVEEAMMTVAAAKAIEMTLLPAGSVASLITEKW